MKQMTHNDDTRDEDALRRLLAAEDPTPRVVTEQEQHELDLLATAVMRQGRHPSRKPGRRVAVVTAATVGLALVGTAAAATAWTARTGEHRDSYGVAVGEELDPTAPDFPAEVRALTPDYPLPAEMTWEPFVERIIQVRQSPESGGRETDLTIGRQVESMGWCAWTAQWLAAHESGDTAATADAVVGVRSTTRWRNLMLQPTDGLSSAVRQSVDAAESGDVNAMNDQRYSLCD